MCSFSVAKVREIKPTLTRQDILCVETVADATALVVFGASGDLTRRKLLGSLFELYRRDLITERFYLIGCGRKEFTDQQFHRIALESLGQGSGTAAAEKAESFTEKLYYISGDYADETLYDNIKAKLVELDGRHEVDGHVFYLAVPPVLYGAIAEKLCAAGLSGDSERDSQHQPRLVVEKPFGHDSQSAAELNDTIRRCFHESQIYRIDHYLGKETVQNILMFRFANTIFEPVWNRNYIDSVQITIAETVGVEHRAGYYDKSGALRDMFQNHMLQMLALVAMEPPVSFEADRLRDEKVKLLRSIRPFNLADLDKLIIRGQYGPGAIDARQVPGYREEPDIDPKSKTETFVAAKLFVDNWRWKGVPFYLRTGKRLPGKDTEIAVVFKNVPHSMFMSVGLEDVPANVLVLQIQPKEGISLSFQAKRPGSKICMDTLNMSFNYQDIFGVSLPEAYERLLLDCMVGDQALFTRYDSVEVAWQLLTPVLQAWENDACEPHEYPAGSAGCAEAERLIEIDGRKWRPIG